MAEFDDAALRRQVGALLDSLKAAGVDWTPRGPRLDRRAIQAAAAARHANSPSQPIAETLGEPDMPAPQKARRQQLDLLSTEIKSCVRCTGLCSTRTQTVFGAGPFDPDVCFLGEAPGADEDAQGTPFVGAAGQLLNKIIAACGFQREEVYICNILKCRPPGNRTPLPDEADNCLPFLKRQLDIVRPRFIVCLGGTAAKYLLNTNVALGELRGRFHEYNGIPVVVTYHPAYLLPHRAPAKKKDVWDDMKMLLAKMGRPIPQRANAVDRPADETAPSA